MLFLNRHDELEKLDRLVATGGGLAVIYGRRRLGKTRLLVEWTSRASGIYFVADQSTADVQREYFAEAVAERLPGFADVRYRDWRSLLARLASDSLAVNFRGPLVIDELPYLVEAAPELPSVLQDFCDHAARRAKLSVAIAGSSQRMMQGLVLAPNAPLYGRAKALFEVQALRPEYLRVAFPRASVGRALDCFTAWGGVPRYWELASEARGSVENAVDALVLDAGGVLHDEPMRLLLEESPSASELRPLLDAIGAGAHRVSEIAGRIGRAATSLSRPLERLRGLGLVEREIPFGHTERDTKRSLYKLLDPFFRLWFRVVAPHRGFLLRAPKSARIALLRKHWELLRGQAWEQLCRERLASMPAQGRRTLGAWRPPQRFWQGSGPEWDLVSESDDERALLLGEVRAHAQPATLAKLSEEARALASKPPPVLPAKFTGRPVVRALFVPDIAPSVPKNIDGVRIVTFDDLVPKAPGARPRAAARFATEKGSRSPRSSGG